MQCKHSLRRTFARRPPVRAEASSETREPHLITRPLPASLVKQLAEPLSSMSDIETLLAHLYVARSRGYF